LGNGVEEQCNSIAAVVELFSRNANWSFSERLVVGWLKAGYRRRRRRRRRRRNLFATNNNNIKQEEHNIKVSS